MLKASRLGVSSPHGGTSAPTMPSVKLHTGYDMPLVAFGTLMESLEPDYDVTVRTIEDALDVGYRHLDTAQVYNTESMCGAAIRNKVKAGEVTREEVFVTTKLWRNAFGCTDVVPALKASLAKLGLDYVDLFLVHWPTAFVSGPEVFPKQNGKFVYADTDYLETWKGMEECVDLGLTRSIGLSNFNSKQIQRVVDHSRIKPANLQIECHPYLSNSKLVQFCRDRDISVMAYAPLFGYNKGHRESCGWPSLFEDQKIQEIAKQHKAAPAQVALGYQLQRGVGVAPKSSKRHRMEENFASQLMVLSEAEMQTMESLNQNLRLNAEFPDHPYYPFHEEY